MCDVFFSRIKTPLRFFAIWLAIFESVLVLPTPIETGIPVFFKTFLFILKQISAISFLLNFLKSKKASSIEYISIKGRRIKG